MSVEGIKCAIRNVRLAKDRLNAEVARTFPVGAEIVFEKRGHRQTGTVLGHGSIGRAGAVRVKNIYTDKSYWITMFDVVGYIA